MYSDTQKTGIRKTLGILLGIIMVMLSLIFLNYVTRDVALSAEQAAMLDNLRTSSGDLQTAHTIVLAAVTQNGLALRHAPWSASPFPVYLVFSITGSSSEHVQQTRPPPMRAGSRRLVQAQLGRCVKPD